MSFDVVDTLLLRLVSFLRGFTRPSCDETYLDFFEKPVWRIVVQSLALVVLGILGHFLWALWLGVV